MIEKLHSHEIDEISITRIGGDTEHLDVVFGECSIYHSIQNMITTGYVTIREQGSLIDILPITGKEIIKIKFRTFHYQSSDSVSSAKEASKLKTNPLVPAEKYYDRCFFVYAVDTIQIAGDTNKYVIRFTDALGMLSNDVRLSIRYTGKPDEIIDGIFKDVIAPYTQYYNGSGEQISFTPFEFKSDSLFAGCENDIDFVVPNWKLLPTIQYITSQGISNNNKGIQKFTDCVFFQRADGTYTITDYASMFNITGQEPIIMKRTPANVIGADLKYNIVSYSFNTSFNSQLNKLNRILGQTVYTVDFFTQEVKEQQLDYNLIFSTVQNYVNTGTNITKPYEFIEYAPQPQSEYSNNNNVSVEAIKCFNFKTAAGMESIAENKFVYSNDVLGTAIRNHLTSIKIGIELDGVSDIDIGVPVQIELNEMIEPNKQNSITASLNNTVWVVSNIRHVFSAGECKTFVELFTPCLGNLKS